MRVLLISHTCQSRTEGQPKAHFLGQIPGLELRVVVPTRWKHYGRWRRPDPPLSETFQYEPARVRLPWVGPAQFYLHYYPDLARTFREFKPDVIDLWEEPWALVSAQACRLRRRLCPNARIVSETEQNILKTLPPPFERIRAYTLSQADHAVARNTEAVDVLRAKGYRGPATVVPNGVDAELFRPLDRAACRATLKLTGFVVGYVGRLVDEKGLLDLVEALPHCPPQVNLLFVGSGSLEPELRTAADRLGVADRVRLLPARPLTELPSIMNAIDVLALPSRTTARWKEQFGRVLIEANACGTPVIGSRSGAIPDVVGQAGLTVPERDPRSLASAIARLQADPAEARRMGETGRRQVEELYTWERVAQRMAAVYQLVLAGPLAVAASAPASPDPMSPSHSFNVRQ
jgi:glycosyltransferase involved in cell wall biosynthesis